MRLSPGAELLISREALASLSALKFSNLAAPEDGRSPGVARSLRFGWRRWVHGNPFGFGDARGHISGPRLACLRLILSGSSRYRRDMNKHLASRALNLTTGICLVALKALFAVGTFEFELGHRFWLVMVNYT